MLKIIFILWCNISYINIYYTMMVDKDLYKIIADEFSIYVCDILFFSTKTWFYNHFCVHWIYACIHTTCKVLLFNVNWIPKRWWHKLWELNTLNLYLLCTWWCISFLHTITSQLSSSSSYPQLHICVIQYNGFTRKAYFITCMVLHRYLRKMVHPIKISFCSYIQHSIKFSKVCYLDTVVFLLCWKTNFSDKMVIDDNNNVIGIWFFLDHHFKNNYAL